MPLLQAEGRADEACNRAWLAAPLVRRVEEHVRLLSAAAEAALDLGQPARAAAWLARAAELPVVAYELQALLLILMARLRLARTGEGDTATTLADVRAWQPGAVLPALERHQLQQAMSSFEAAHAG